MDTKTNRAKNMSRASSLIATTASLSVLMTPLAAAMDVKETRPIHSDASGSEFNEELQVVPGVYPAEVSQEVRSLIDQLNGFGASHIQGELVQKGPSIVPELLVALRAISTQQSARPAMPEAEIVQLERRKIQLYAVISKLASREVAPVLIEVAMQSRDDSYAFIVASNALDEIGATREADEFAIALAKRPDASKAMLLSAFARFQYRPAPPAILAAAEKNLDPSNDYRLRNPALRIMAISGKTTRALSAYKAALVEPRYLDYGALSALAEVIKPEAFARLIENVPFSESTRAGILKHSQYAWADSDTKSRDAEAMMWRGKPSECNAIALKHLLANERSDLLKKANVVVPRLLNDLRSVVWEVSPHHTRIIARLGYRLRIVGEDVVVERIEGLR